ncbi:Putative Sec7 domain, PH-like domain superfamily, sec7 domain superfamily, pleckstrin domain 9 [Septoria linicola]|uniref:Sec7 domain, PH-like domain superfamily, sec7 domain superfamily, pleckstrin domain 9 n=1 Tax=Septoria linicola TaxID=215465 RepID=A0A9Q9ER07_9PEZI|nr:putative Sec7 domain, PH-like domain superfamily, sec7 domain superfamily, pleckstrin domain 9 [Septoria linicola]USW59384.1 Putative Sec7 domain, PH-like domain superfamily, sec7 domain superfamily, pleckstrin domain 9 [Septoria linicola]
METQQYASASASASATAHATTVGADSPPNSPPVPPSIRTSSRGFRDGGGTSSGYGGGSPPHTPPPRPHSKRRGKQPVRPRYSPESPEIITAPADQQRHSHGLSWHSTTRDSVVDNLLFSLDSFSRQDFGAMGEHEDGERHAYLQSLTGQYPSNQNLQRARGHTHSSSDSEYARHMESPGGRSVQSGKGRRSNSNSISGLGHSLTSRLKPNGAGRQSADTQRTINDKSSVNGEPSGNYTNGAMLESSILPAFATRSISMEQIQSESDEPSVLTRGRPVPSVHSRYESNNNSDAEAAPEPVIAAGPRKQQNPGATGPVYVNSANAKAQRPSQLRKTTTQDNLRAKAGNAASPIPPGIRNQAADFVRTESMRGGITGLPPPSAQSSVAPSPGINMRRRDASPPREKQGFFKRVFGGSSRVVSTPTERPTSKQVTQNARPEAPIRSVSQASAGNPQPNADSQQATAANMPSAAQMLNKKPSSFFRRTKKSTSESFQPPPLPVPSDANANFSVNKAQPSPSISSLRKVMDPYLSQDAREPNGTSKLKDDISVSRPTTSDTKTEDSEDPDIFHSGYTPPLDASLNARYPIAGEQGSPNSKLKIKKTKPDALVIAGNQDLDDERDPSRDTPRTTLRDRSNEAGRVSPISDTHPNIARDYSEHMLSSRPSTGDRIIVSKENSPVEPSSVMRDFSAGTNVSLNIVEDGWYVKPHPMPDRPPSKTSDRLVLRPTASEEQLGRDSDLSTIEGSTVSPALTSDGSAPGSATMQSITAPDSKPSGLSSSLLLPSLTVNNDHGSRKSSDPTIIRVPSPLTGEGAEYKERARKIFAGDEEDVSKNDAAAWLGERNTLSTKTLSAYMQLFDFCGLNALAALRLLCSKLILRGETQQFDRIITALSARWCECNPNHGFKAQDVIHTIFYSVILLNTDLHLADIEERMSRSAYVKNTLPTIRRVVQDAAPDAFGNTLKPTSALRPSMPWANTNSSDPLSPTLTPATPSTPAERVQSSPLQDAGSTSAMNVNVKRLSIRPSAMRNDSDTMTPESAANGVSNALVNSPWTGTMRGWEAEVETVLKSFFTSIRTEPLPLHGVSAHDVMGNRNLSVVDLNSTLRRSGSIVSKAPSDAMSSMSYRSHTKDFRSTMRWPGRSNRSRPKVYPASTVGSSRTSFDDGSGFWSPAQSSKYSFNKTLTSASVNSFSNLSAMGDFKHSIGFANALSSAIIREETSGGDSESFSMAGGLLEDESLALEGAPWAKEGLLKHKSHLDAPDRKSKERNWNDCFAVISKGKLTLFAFGTSNKSQSLGRKAPFGRSGKAASVTGARVGGGDWMENAEQLEVFVLRQTIASTLPPPGYSKARPHVWALSLPNGAVHLFQVGTPEIAMEFMTTANYWSARLSKEPLAGGVSNIEYGWSEQVVNTALVERPETFTSPPTSMTTRGHTHSVSANRNQRPSLQSSLRSSLDTGFGNNKIRLPADKVMIHEWQPPTQSMMASQLMEVDQLKQLTAYVENSEEELEKHNELKHAIELAYSPRHPNFNKALANWQRKSDYLLREIVKFRTYMDSLSAAQKAKEAFYAKKAEGRQSPSNPRDDDVHDLPRIDDLMGAVTPRGIYTSG